MSTGVRKSIGCSTPRWVLLLWVVFASGFAGAAEEVITDPPGRVARLSHTDGEVVIAPAGTEEWAEAILNRPLTSGDRLWTESGARAELQIGSAAAYLDERTSFGFIELDDDIMQMSLTEGSVTLRVRRLSESESIQVETPNVAVALREPGEYHIEVDAQTDQTIVKTRHGEAEVFGGEVAHVLRANESGTFTGLDALSARVERLGPRTAFENWANERERRESESRSAEYVSRDVVGYEDLDEHGDWLHEPEYGYVWRPRAVAYDWVPYRHGRWIWVSPWGWTWVDRAPWGFAPFHYGRWAFVRHRWCWVPGPRHYRPIYAPALVGWIGRPHVGVSVSFGSGIGWFPLAPREVYIPGYRHSPRYIRHVNMSNTIIVNNTYITNVYSGRYRDFEYRYRSHPRAVTAVEHGRFIGGRPVLGRIMRVNEHELSQWQPAHRPPALAPDRASVLAGSVRRAPPLHRLNDRGLAPRIAFDAERRRIEANGGRPIGRTHLYRVGPKDGSDFNPRHRGVPRLSSQDDAPRSTAPRGQRIESLPARSNVQQPGETAIRTRDVPRLEQRRDRVVRGLRTGESSRPSVPVEREHARGQRSFDSPPSSEALRTQRERYAPRVRTTPEVRGRIESHRNDPPRSVPRSIGSGSNETRSRSRAPTRIETRPSPPASAQPSRPSSPPRAHSAPRQDSGRRSMTHGNFRNR